MGLPVFCREWRGRHVILVSTQEALRALCSHASNRFLKRSRYGVSHLLSNEEAGYALLVFDASPTLAANANVVQSFGGDPVLVINVVSLTTTLEMEELNLLVSNGVAAPFESRTIWGIDLPFWCHYILDLTSPDPDELQRNRQRFAVQLLSGSAFIQTHDERQQLAAVAEIVAVSAAAAAAQQQQHTCSSCFSAQATEHSLSCGHAQCVSCASVLRACYAKEHRREFFSNNDDDADNEQSQHMLFLDEFFEPMSE